jgi:hypothetical protein
VWDVRERLEENFRRVEAMLTEMQIQEDGRLRLAAAAELRKHIALAESTLAVAVKAETQRLFEETVIAAIAEVGPALRRKVIDRLNAEARKWVEAENRRPARRRRLVPETDTIRGSQAA